MRDTARFCLKNSKAFTLSELLIALVILGVIATFAIPKILQSQQAAQQKAVFKEAVAALSQAAYQESLQDSPQTDSYAVFKPRLNYVKEVFVGTDDPTNTLYLSSGVALSNFNANSTLDQETILITYNTSSVFVVVCWNKTGCPSGSGQPEPFDMKAGQVFPVIVGFGAPPIAQSNTDFFNSLFQ